MNLEIKSKRERGKGVIYTTPCPKSNKVVAYRAGNPKYCSPEKCEFCKRIFLNKDGKLMVHCLKHE